MTDQEFLQWIYDRLLHVHKENKYLDYMTKLQSIINAMPASTYTPNVASSDSILRTVYTNWEKKQ